MRLLAFALALSTMAPLAAAQTIVEADDTRTMAVEAWVPAAPADVWEAVTTAEGWKSWAVPAAWYAATDVLHLHALKARLDAMLAREGRTELAAACMGFVSTRAELDLAGWHDLDIFAH